MPDEDVATAEEQEEHKELTEQEQDLAKLKESIEVKVEDIGTLRKKLTITVPKTAIEERRSEQFSEIKRDAVVPGFRKGHAPLPLVQKRFGHDVNEQLSAQLLSSSYLAAVEKEDLKTIGDPLIWARDKKAPDDAPVKLVKVEDAFDLITLPTDGDLTFSCEVEVRPEFALPKLEGIRLEQPKISVGKKEIDAYIDRLRAMRGHYEPMPDAKIEADDLVVCDLKITAGDRVVMEQQNCQLAARPQRLAGIPMENLGKTLGGAGVGDNRTFEVNIPEDFEDESLRGQQASVALNVQDIKRLVLPDLDGEFLEQLGMESKKELTDWAKGMLESQRNEESAQKQREQLAEYLLQNTTVDLPRGLSQQQADRIAARRVLELARRGVPESEIAKQADAIKVGAQSDAVKDLKLQFIFEKIAEDWEVEVSEDEINGQIATIAQRQNRRFDRVRDELIRSNSLSALYVHVRDEKIMDSIIEKAEIVEAAGSGRRTSGAKKTTTKKKAAKKSDA